MLSERIDAALALLENHLQNGPSGPNPAEGPPAAPSAMALGRNPTRRGRGRSPDFHLVNQPGAGNSTSGRPSRSVSLSPT